MELIADVLKIFVGTQTDINFFVIPGVVAVGVGLKYWRKIDGIDA